MQPSKHAGTWFRFRDGFLVQREGDKPEGKALRYQDATGKIFMTAPKKATKPKKAQKEEG